MSTSTTDDPVLTQLREDWQAKSDEATAVANAVLKDPAATKEMAAKAENLYDEKAAIEKLIVDRNETLARIAALKSKHSQMHDWANQPNRTLSFGGKGGHGNGTEAKGRVDLVESEFDKREPTGGFKSLGHFAWCVFKGGDGLRGEPSAVQAIKGWMDLQQKAPIGMFEESDPDGGLLVPRGFSTQIYERMLATNDILRYLSPIPVSGNTMTLPALKENSRVDGSRGGGVQGYWIGEADTYTPSRPKFRDLNLKLKKLIVMMVATDELIADSAVALDTFMLSRAPKEINFKINDAVLNGTGNAMPLGIMNSGSKITVSAVSAQGANTLVYANIVAMYSRITSGQRGSLIWLYNQDVEPQLMQMYMALGTAAGLAIFTPNTAGNGFSLMGRPAIVVEQAQTLGTAGDLIAFATDGYACITKGGVESSMSIHLYFDTDQQAFKWRLRFDGQPYDEVALTPYKGSNTTSAIVVLNSTRT